MSDIESRVAIVIPTYNERANIRKLLVVLKRQYSSARIFVVDDSSPDGTAEIVQEIAEEYGGVRLIRREKKGGMASAYIDALARIIPDDSIEYIVSMDADLSHHPADLSRLLRQAPRYDLVVGSRYVPGGEIENWALWRRFISKYGSIYTRLIAGVPIRDLTAGFVVYRRSLLFQVLPFIKDREPYAYQTDMKYLAYQQGARMTEVPITFRERASGKSKFKGRAVLEALVFPWYLRFFR